MQLGVVLVLLQIMTAIVVVVVVVVSSFRIQGTQEPVSVPQFLGKGTDVKLHKSHK